MQGYISLGRAEVSEAMAAPVRLEGWEVSEDALWLEDVPVSISSLGTQGRTLLAEELAGLQI